jgi:hypothetical protein
MTRHALRGLVVVVMLALPALALGATSKLHAVPNVTRMEAGAGIKALTRSGFGTLARYTINCPNLHTGNGLRIAYQLPAAGLMVPPTFPMTIVVARQGIPKASRSEPLPAHLSRAQLCASVSR